MGRKIASGALDRGAFEDVKKFWAMVQAPADPNDVNDPDVIRVLLYGGKAMGEICLK